MQSQTADTLAMQRTVVIAYHVCAVPGAWKPIVDEQVRALSDSGLLCAKDLRAIYVTIVGKEAMDAEEYLTRHLPRLSVLIVNPEDTTYERAMLERLHLVVDHNDDILYMHTKGVTKPTNTHVRDWRQLLQHFLITRYEECRQKLASGSDVVGVNYQDRPEPHFSGNFWWTRGSYFIGLPIPIGKEYLDPEMWLFKNGPSKTVLHNSNRNHYVMPYPRSRYA